MSAPDPLESATYRLEVAGPVSADEINSHGPCAVVEADQGATSAVLLVRTDQAGLIGLLRYLSTAGLALVSLTRQAGAGADVGARS